MASFQSVLDAISAERSKSSRQNYDCAIASWRRIHRYDPINVTHDDVRKWQTIERQRLKSTTLSLYWTLLETLHEWCFQAGIAPQQNPFKSPFAGRKPNQRSEAVGQPAIEPDEVEAILATFDQETWIGRRNHLAIGLLFRAGLRACEVCALNAQDIEPRGGGIVLRVWSDKTRRREIQAVPDALQQELVYWTAEIDPDGPLFPSANPDCTRGDGRLGYRRLLDALHRARRKVGAAIVGTHAGRATVATRALSEGLPVRDVMHYLRHRDPSVTIRYDRGANEAQTRVAKIF